MNDATFRLRVPTSELQEWKRKAGNVPLSRWMRERCSQEWRRELIERIARGLCEEDGWINPSTVREKIERLAALNPR